MCDLKDKQHSLRTVTESVEQQGDMSEQQLALMSHAWYSSIAQDYNPEKQSIALEEQHRESALKLHSKLRVIE